MVFDETELEKRNILFENERVHPLRPDDKFAQNRFFFLLQISHWKPARGRVFLRKSGTRRKFVHNETDQTCLFTSG